MRRFSLMLCLVLAFGAGGCGLLDSTTEIRVELPVQEFDFELDASIVKAQLQAYLDSQGIGIDISGMQELPADVAGVPLTIQQTFELELPPEQVDLSDEEDLRQYIESGKIKSVKIKFIRADIATNSLNFQTPEIEMWMDDLSATGITANSDQVAIIPSIAAGATGEVDLEFTPGGRDTMSNYLLSYQFALMAMVAITIDTSVTRTIPDGLLQGKLKISLEFTADPL